MPTPSKARARPRPKPQPAGYQTRPASSPLRDLRHRYALSQALLSRLLDVSLRTLSSAQSTVAVPSQLQRSATQAARLCDALGEAMRPAFVGQWLDQPNELLDNLKPIEAIERGQIDLVWQIAQGLRSGSQL